MPRSYNGLWDKITSWENLVGAYVGARKGKKTRADVMRFHCDLEANLCEIRERLLDGAWAPQPFNSFERVTEAKRRQIQAPVFADRVVIWPTHRLPRKRVVQAAKRRFERISREHAEGRAGFDDVRAVVVSFLGYMQHCKGKRSADSALKRMLLRRR